MHTRKILIISNPEDGHIPPVEQMIESLGHKSIRMYPQDLGDNLYSWSYIDNSLTSPSCWIKDRNTNISYELNDFFSIWYRRPRFPLLQELSLTEQGKDFADAEWKVYIQNSFEMALQPLWVSRPSHIDAANNKQSQLTIATELGFTIPKSILTNDEERARMFYEECGGRVICKATGRGWVMNSAENDYWMVLTNRVLRHHLEEFKTLQTAPVTFQEEIEKLYEVRVNVVGNECLAIKIDSQQSQTSKIDWRNYDIQNTPYTPFKLPAKVQERCLRLCSRLGLEFGAIDLICRSDEEFVFLEINPNGQFLWAEVLSGVKVSRAVASLLTGSIEPLNNKAWKV